MKNICIIIVFILLLTGCEKSQVDKEINTDKKIDVPLKEDIINNNVTEETKSQDIEGESPPYVNYNDTTYQDTGLTVDFELSKENFEFIGKLERTAYPNREEQPNLSSNEFKIGTELYREKDTVFNTIYVKLTDDNGKYFLLKLEPPRKMPSTDTEPIEGDGCQE